MPKYKIIETRPAIQTWIFEVEADSEKEALEQVMSNEAVPNESEYNIDNPEDAESKFDIEEIK